MTNARVFSPENHLARHLRQGGPSSEELIAAADSRVTALAGSIRVFVAAKVQQILALSAQTDDILFAEADIISNLAMNVAEVAGAARLDALSDVSRGVITMIEGLKSLGIWHTDALRLHIRSLSLLSPEATALSARDETQIVENLRNMRQAIGLMT